MKHNYKVRIISAVLLPAPVVMAVLPASALTVGKQDPALSIVSTPESGTYDAQARYTPFTWSEFKAALDAAKLVAGDGQASEEDTTGRETETVAESETVVGTQTETQPEKRGCGSVLMGGLTVALAPAAYVLLRNRRKED